MQESRSKISGLLSLAVAMSTLGNMAGRASKAMREFNATYPPAYSPAPQGPTIRHGNNRKEESRKRHAKAKVASKARRAAAKRRKGK